MVCGRRPRGSTACARNTAKVAVVTPLEHAHDAACLLSLQKVAESLGVTRAAVNSMVHDGRLDAVRLGPRWYVCESVFERFRSGYRPPPSAGRKLGPRGGEPQMVEVVYALLVDWGEARVDELSEVLGRHPGNVRKYLAVLRARGLARRVEGPVWAAESRLGATSSV